MKAFFVIALFLFGSSAALAQTQNQDVDPYSQDALEKTQNLLNEPGQRQKTVDKSPDAARADGQVQELTGNKKVSADVYKLAADVFANMVKESKGDPVKMQEMLTKFQRDPASFAEHWTPEQKKKLHELSEKMAVPVTNQ